MLEFPSLTRWGLAPRGATFEVVVARQGADVVFPATRRGGAQQGESPFARLDSQVTKISLARGQSTFDLQLALRLEASRLAAGELPGLSFQNATAASPTHVATPPVDLVASGDAKQVGFEWRFQSTPWLQNVLTQDTVVRFSLTDLKPGASVTILPRIDGRSAGKPLVIRVDERRP